MGSFFLETCVDSVASALGAVRGGADRLELCGNLIIGGTTPDIALYREIRKYTDIPIRALLRPRFGDFCYDEYEYSIILENIAMFKDAGVDGVVIGSLNPDGTLNMKQMEGFVKVAEGIGITLHRAIDMTKDGMDSMRLAKSIGIDTILTSGQQSNCLKGREMIRQMVEEAGNAMMILVGAGVSASVIKQMYEDTNATAYHMSGKITKDSQMIYRNPSVNMGLPGISEYEVWETAEDNIRAARNVLNTL